MTTLAPPALPAWRRIVRDGLLLTVRNLRHFVREPHLVVFSTVQPIMFVLLFSFVFGGAIGQALPPGLDYTSFLLPGIFVQAVAFRSTQTAVGLANDLDKGVIDRFKSMPMARSAVLLGRTAADLIRSVFVVLLMAGVGYLIGFRFVTGPLQATAAVLLVALFGFALSWVFAFVALYVRNPEAAQSAAFVAVFPLVFASSAFVPVETMPGWLATITAVSPVTVTVDAVRALAIGGPVLSPLLQSLAWIVAVVAVFMPLSVWRYRRVD